VLKTSDQDSALKTVMC